MNRNKNYNISINTKSVLLQWTSITLAQLLLYKATLYVLVLLIESMKA